MRDQLRVSGVSDAVVDDAVLILSELLSNSCRHGRPLGDAGPGTGDVLASWWVDAAGRLTVEVTDGGGPTRPVPANPSVTAHGGRGLNIITALADEWGVRDDAHGEVTVWVLVHVDQAATRIPEGTRQANGRAPLHSDSGTHPPAAGKGARRSTAAAHGLRPAHRHGADRDQAARRATRPLPTHLDRGFADALDDPE